MNRAVLWAYIGHPEAETPARRRVLYAIVVLRAGLGAAFLILGWTAVFAASREAFAARLGDASRWGLSAPLAADMALFMLGCTELLVGALQIVGAFTRLTASTGLVLLTAYFALGAHTALAASAFPSLMGGLIFLIVCGSPFLSVDRFLDKVEEEERDRAPVALPAVAVSAALAPRLGVAISLLLISWSVGARADRDGLVYAGIAAAVGALGLALAVGFLPRVLGAAGGLIVAVSALHAAPGGPSFALGATAVGVALLIAGTRRRDNAASYPPRTGRAI